jgi:glycosyltransferase involved in cell wall biosynthesis
VYHSLRARESEPKTRASRRQRIKAAWKRSCEARLSKTMSESQPSLSTGVLFSIIIAVYNDWTPLEGCLRSLAEQHAGTGFEVIIADDGSSKAAPESVRRWSAHFPLKIIRLSHSGISTARNQATQISRGSILFYVDADCRLQPDCLSALSHAIASATQHDYFQLHLVGNCHGTVGKAEELRLTMLQHQTLQPDGRIRYLNTAGFAIRRTAVNIAKGVFDPAALRAEDTFFMAGLLERGKLPLFVPDATVQHDIPLSLLQCLRKDMRSVWLEARTYEMIALKGVKFRLNYRERFSMLQSMWKTTGEKSLGRWPWFVVTGRQGLRLLVSYLYHFFRAIGLSAAKS